MLPHAADVFLFGAATAVIVGFISLLGVGDGIEGDKGVGWNALNRLVSAAVFTLALSVLSMSAFTVMYAAHQRDVRGQESYRQWWDDGREQPPSWQRGE